MWLVGEGFPCATPFETEGDGERGHLAIKRRVVEVSAAVPNADVEGESEVVVAVTGWRVGDFATGSGAPFGVEGGLLGVGAEAGDELDGDAFGRSGTHEITGFFMQTRMQRSNHCFTAWIDGGTHSRKVAHAMKTLTAQKANTMPKARAMAAII